MAVYKRDILDVNLETGNIYRSFLNHSIGYKDAKADHFGVRVFRDGEAVNLTGVSVQGVFMPPQGSPIAITSGNIVSGNVAEVVLPQACYNYNGQFTLAIKLVDSSNSVTGTVRIVDGVVDNTHASGTVAPTSAVPTYQEVLSTYEQAIAAINKTVRFDAAQSLTETQKAQARANIDAVSSATANELAMEIGAIVESVDNNSYIDLGNKWMTFRRGYYSTPAAGSASSYNSSSDYVYALAACQPGDVLKAHTYGSSSVYAWAFLDSSLNVLSRGGTGNFEGTQTAPASTAFALVNNKIGSMGSGYYAYVGGEAIQDQVTSLKSAMDGNLPDGIQAATGVRVYPFQYGYESTPAEGSVSSHTYSTNYMSVKIPVTSSDVVYFSGSGGTGIQRLFAILDEDSKLIYRTTTNNDGAKTVTISNYTGAAYIIINSKASYTGKVYCYIGKNTVETDTEPVQNSTKPVQSGGVYSEIKTIKDAIGEQQTNVTGESDSGYYWNSETSTAVKTVYSDYKAYAPIDVAEGDKMRLVATRSGNSNKQYPFLFVDDDYAIISHEGDRNVPVDLTVLVPVGATKLLMTCGKNQFCTAYVLELKPIPDNSFSGSFAYKGKNVAIIGDSISTNGDYSNSNPLGNVPEIIVADDDIGVELSAYVTYYDVGTTIGGHTISESEVGTELTFTPVEGDQGKMVGKPKNNNPSTTDVWWEVAAAVLGFNPIPVCWSGSSITDHEENDTESGHYIYKCAHSFHTSQIRKCGIRTPGSMTRTAPDMIIIYRGTNDLTHSPYARLTDDLDSFPTTYPDADTFDDGGTTRYSFVKGMRILIKKLHEAYPEAKVVLCTLNYFRRMSTDKIYDSNGFDNWLSYNAMIRQIADYECCDLIEFDKDGLDYWNATGGYYDEGTSSTAHWTHPNTKGQARLGSRALVDLRTVNDMTVPT